MLSSSVTASASPSSPPTTQPSPPSRMGELMSVCGLHLVSYMYISVALVYSGNVSCTAHGISIEVYVTYTCTHMYMYIQCTCITQGGWRTLGYSLPNLQGRISSPHIHPLGNILHCPTYCFTPPPPPPPPPHTHIDERPSLPELLSFPTITGDTINVMSRVGTKYDQLGYILLNDEDGSTVDQIIDYHHHSPERIASEILKKWIRGKGKQPVTWKTLTDTLRAVGLTELATCIETSLTSPHSSHKNVHRPRSSCNVC